MRDEMEWREISTAPKDGTRVLIYVYGTTYACHFDGSWQTGLWTSVNDREYPTHWMPLPDPPTNDQGEG